MSLIGKLLVKLGFDGSEFIQGTRQAEQTTQNFTGKISGMFGKMVAGFAIGAAIKKAFDFGKEAYQAAAQAEGVKIAFDRLNDPSLLNNLKEATKGTVDELKMMQLAVQAKNFRLPVEQLGTYLKFATKRAQETGVSVDYLTNSIITGLGRKSVMILDNLGISAVEIREEMKKGGDMAEATSRIIQREMAKAGDITENAAIKAEQISAKWSDFKSNLGNTTLIQKAGNAIQNFLISVIDSLNDSLTYLGKTSIDKWVAKNITNPMLSSEEAVENLNIQLDASEKKLKTLGEGNTGFIKGVQRAGSDIVKLLSFGFYDPDFGGHNQRDFAKASRVAAQTGGDSRHLQEATKEHLATLDIKKKTNEELIALQKKYAGESLLLNNSTIKQAIGEEQTLRVNAEAEASEKAAEETKKRTEEAKKRAEELRKAQLSYKESENTSAISQLQKQSETYGTTLVYMEELLRLRREQEQYAESDAEYQQLVRSNSELEKKISLRKQSGDGNEVGSEAYLKNQISEAEAAMAKLNTRTAEGKAAWNELATSVENWKHELNSSAQKIELQAIIVASLPEGSRERIQAELEQIEMQKLALPVGAQEDWDKLNANAVKLKETLKQFPREMFPKGSIADFDQQIKDLTEGLNLLTGAELDATMGAIALLEAQKAAASDGFKTLLDKAKDEVALYEKLVAITSDERKKYYEEQLKEAKDVQEALESSMGVALRLRDIAQTAAIGFAESMGNMIAGGSSLGESLEEFVLLPILDLAKQVGEAMITFGMAGIGLKKLITNPYLAVAAGIALVALSSAAKTSIQNKVSGGGSSSGGGSTFTGGYSNGTSSNYKTPALASASSRQQVVVLETRVNGSDLMLVQSKEQNRRSR